MNKDFSGNKFCVYLHIRPDTGAVFYVGIGTRKRPNRGKGRNNYWQNIVNKNNGKFIVEVLCKDISRYSACQIEIGIINYYGRKDIGAGILANLTNGGEGTVKISQDAINRRNIKMAELRKNPEYQKRISESHKGCIVLPETRAKISKTLTGRIIPAEARKNMGLVKRGLVLSNNALIKRFSVIVRKRGWVIDQIDISTNKVLGSFASIKSASEVTGVTAAVIYASLNGKIGRGLYKWTKNYDKNVIKKALESYTVPLKIEAA